MDNISIIREVLSDGSKSLKQISTTLNLSLKQTQALIDSVSGDLPIYEFNEDFGKRVVRFALLEKK